MSPIVERFPTTSKSFSGNKMFPVPAARNSKSELVVEVVIKFCWIIISSNSTALIVASPKISKLPLRI